MPNPAPDRFLRTKSTSYDMFRAMHRLDRNWLSDELLLVTRAGAFPKDNVSPSAGPQGCTASGYSLFMDNSKMIMINNKNQDYNNDNMPIRRDHEDALRGRRLFIDCNNDDNTNV